MRSLLAFCGALVTAICTAGIGALYSAIAILVVSLIWQSRNSGVYQFLWGLSFASYSLPKIVDQSLEKFSDALEVMKDTREVCKVFAKDGHVFNFAGAYFERCKLSRARQCFFSAGLDANGFIFKEWEADFTIVVFLTSSGLVIYWGKTMANLVTWWMPKMVQIDYKIDWKDRTEDSMTFSALRRRDIHELQKFFIDFGVNNNLRPLLQHQTRLQNRSLDLENMGIGNWF